MVSDWFDCGNVITITELDKAIVADDLLRAASAREFQKFDSQRAIDSSEPEQICVQGRLKEHSEFWLNELESSDFVKNIVQYGYRMPFLVLPAPVFKFNHQSAVMNKEFVSSAIDELVEGRCITACKECPLVCSPLSVVKKDSGKCRLVVDLRYVNQFLLTQKFKYEGLNLVPDLLRKGEYFFTFDLKSGYHHVDIHEDCQQYLGFSWVKKGVRRFYTFRVLPFGLSTACYVFTKLLRPLVKRWRSKAIRSIVYIDDGIIVSKSEQLCLTDQKLVLSDLKQAGLVLSLNKCALQPCQTGNWLGFTIDLADGKFYIQEKKLDKLKNAVKSISALEKVPVRALGSVVGQIMSMGLALGPITRLRTRALYALINSSTSWSDRLQINTEAQMELNFWAENIDSLNGEPIWFRSGATRVVYSDASSSGYGGYSVELGNEVAHGLWSADEAHLSSTWRELKAVYLVLLPFANKLAGHAVKWFTDNQGVVHIVRAGSRKQHLQDGAMAIFELCFTHSIKLEMEWIPRSQNECADSISRIVDYDDWGISPYLFQVINATWGPHTVDCFASYYNALLPRFHSRFWMPGCEAVDTFTTNWSGEINCWVPPLHLVCRTITHAAQCNAKGTLIIPAWRSAPYWPIVCPDGCHLARFIHQWSAMSFFPAMFRGGRSGNSIGNSLNIDSIVLALLIDFTIPVRLTDNGFCTIQEAGICSLFVILYYYIIHQCFCVNKGLYCLMGVRMTDAFALNGVQTVLEHDTRYLKSGIPELPHEGEVD